MKSLKSDTKGTIAIEAAIILPLVVTLIFGIIQFSFAYNEILKTKSSMNVAIRKILLVREPNSAQILQIFNDNIHQSQNSTITTSIAYETKFGSDYVNLSANVSYSLHIPFTENLTINKSLKSSIVLNKL